MKVNIGSKIWRFASVIHFVTLVSLIPPGKVRKPLVLWDSQGEKKGTSGVKWVNW